jgi:hypothetical protein
MATCGSELERMTPQRAADGLGKREEKSSENYFTLSFPQ